MFGVAAIDCCWKPFEVPPLALPIRKFAKVASKLEGDAVPAPRAASCADVAAAPAPKVNTPCGLGFEPLLPSAFSLFW